MLCNVTPHDQPPLTRPMIGDLRIHFPGFRGTTQYAQGSGTLIHPRLILTVGHNVFDPLHQRGGKPDSIEVRLDGQPPVVATMYNTTTQWETRDAYSPQRHLSGFDVGVVFLPHALPVNGPQLEPVARDDGDLLNVGVWQDGFVGVPMPPLREAFAAILQLSKRRLFYPIQTLGGQSGGPVYVPAVDGRSVDLVGVHASRLNPHPAFKACGSAVRLTSDMVTLIQNWQEQADRE